VSKKQDTRYNNQDTGFPPVPMPALPPPACPLPTCVGGAGRSLGATTTDQPPDFASKRSHPLGKIRRLFENYSISM